MNVFFVLTPLQLINALEAKAHFALEDTILIVLRHSSLGYPISMFKRLTDENDWDRIYYLSTFDDERVTRINIFYWIYLTRLQSRRLNKLAASIGPVTNLFIGQYHEPIARHWGNVLPHKTLYLLDDGTSTLETVEARSITHLPLSRRALMLNLKHFLQGIDDRQAEQVTYFTAYDIEAHPRDSVLHNRYANFRKLVTNVPTSDEVWFLGEPLALDGYVTEATYLEYLERIFDYYSGKRFVYLPHSREQRKDVERIGALLGCEVRRFGVPVEYALRSANPRPKEIASFLSSALPNCQIMFGPTLHYTSFHIEPESFTAHEDFAASVYKHFEQLSDSTFRVLKLEPLV